MTQGVPGSEAEANNRLSLMDEWKYGVSFTRGSRRLDTGFSRTCVSASFLFLVRRLARDKSFMQIAIRLFTGKRSSSRLQGELVMLSQ